MHLWPRQYLGILHICVIPTALFMYTKIDVLWTHFLLHGNYLKYGKLWEQLHGSCTGAKTVMFIPKTSSPNIAHIYWKLYSMKVFRVCSRLLFCIGRKEASLIQQEWGSGRQDGDCFLFRYISVIIFALLSRNSFSFSNHTFWHHTVVWYHICSSFRHWKLSWRQRVNLK